MVTAALGLALIAGATACGGGTVAATTGPAVDATTTTAEPGAAFAACLRDQGVDVPDRPRAAGGPPSSRPDGFRPSTSFPPGSRPTASPPAGADQARLAAARQACQSLQPTDRTMPTGPQSQAFQVYASCMKDHGVTVAAGPGGLNRDDPAFKSGDAICASLRPAQP